ncbi:uncharacterized protein LOC114320793 [Camellia sinensis]|uniref:uncharacterized protein LOC114320793 n=1 Tax=Camellia sinensis TaxID=4442 RepID=UPI0010355C27|nr:uncharacterized protein LOC114320793 [Camellia sinensis]
MNGFCLRTHTQHKHNKPSPLLLLSLSLSLHLGFRLLLSLFHTTTAPIIRHRRSSLTPDPPSPSLVPHCRSSSLTAAAASLSLSLTNDVDGCSPLTATPPSPAIFPHRRFQRVFGAPRTTMFILGMISLFIGISLLAPDEAKGKALVSPIERYAVVPDDNVKRINFAEGKI